LAFIFALQSTISISGYILGRVKINILNQINSLNGFILIDKTKDDERREIPINETLKFDSPGHNEAFRCSVCFL